MTTAADEKTCPFCAETIKAAAKVCKHCGRDQPVESLGVWDGAEEPPKTARRWPLVLLAAGGLIAGLMYLGREPEQGSAVGARAICEKFVAARLRDPGSVEWENQSSWPAEQNAYIWTVVMQYRARNGFGGMAREAKVCKVLHEGRGNWKLLSLD